MAAELKAEYGLESVLFAEGKGIFDVLLDGKLIFSKYKEDRFPLDNEIIEIIKA